MEEAENLCKNIVIIDKGKVLAKGTLEELISASQTSEIIQFKVIDKNLFPDFSRYEDVKKIEKDEISGMVTMHVSNTSDFLPELIGEINQTGCGIAELRCRYVTLDDLFIQMTGRKLTDL